MICLQHNHFDSTVVCKDYFTESLRNLNKGLLKKMTTTGLSHLSGDKTKKQESPKAHILSHFHWHKLTTLCRGLPSA